MISLLNVFIVCFNSEHCTLKTPTKALNFMKNETTDMGFRDTDKIDREQWRPDFESSESVDMI